jgi:CubicO group peptidase (beta-lactamase class C family)
MKSTITLFLSVCVLFSCTKHKKPKYTEFEKAYNSFIELATNEFGAKYGMAIAVVKDDAIIYENYLGMADADKDIKVNKNTMFYIASVTKSFTAMAALILESQGKLDFNKSLAEFFPEINFPPKLKADKITLEHFIVHTSGIENDLLGFLKSETGQYSTETLIKILEQYTQVNTSAPFHKFQYTNLGYNILGMILERELGTDWKSLVENEVLEPLKMNHTSTRMSTARKKGFEIAKPHDQVNDSLVRLYIEKEDNTMHAAGGILSSARDMARWLIVELNTGKIDKKQVFDADLIKKSQSEIVPQKRMMFDFKRFAYGYGWNIATTPLGDTIVHHFGSYNGVHPQFSFVPNAGVGVIVMANEGSISQYLNMLLTGYVFDYFSKRENLEIYYKEKLKKYSEKYAKDLKSDNEYMSEIAKRPWKFELPFASYVGTYKNDLFGTIVVEEVEENKLTVTIGHLKSSMVTAHRTNAIRVQMEKRGGTIVQFVLKDGTPEKAIWKGQTFTK